MAGSITDGVSGGADSPTRELDPRFDDDDRQADHDDRATRQEDDRETGRRGGRPGRARVPRARRRGPRLLIGLALLAVGVAALVLLVWALLAALSLERHARAAAADASQVKAALGRADLTGSVAGTRAAARQAAAADAAAHAFPLRVAAHLPSTVGGTTRAVQQLTAATHLALSRGALPLVQVAAAVEDTSRLVRADGSIDVGTLKTESAAVAPAARALAQARRDADAVRLGDVPRQLLPTVRTAQQGIDEVSAKTGTAAATLAVLPSVLGADGPRSYLVVFQNTAELRPTGGIAGSWALVSIDDGRTHLQDYGTDDDLSRVAGPVRDLGRDFTANYPQDKVSIAQDANLSPNFPYAAQLYSDLWTSLKRPAPDGVIAVDPSGMAPLLATAGTVAVPGGPSISSENVVDVMLRQVYIDFAGNNNARKQYLSDVIGVTFAKALSGTSFNATTARNLVSAVRGHHVLAWSAHPAEQKDLVRAGIAGELPDPTRGSAAVYLTNTSGVYLTNIAASKLDYYLHESVSTSGGCEGAPASMKVVLRNDAPPTVPDYVANHVPGVPRTTESLFVALYVPPDRGVAFVTVNGARVPFATGSERGWSLVRFGVTLPRATDTVVQVAFTGAGSPVTKVLTQPMVNQPTVAATRCDRS